MVECEGGDGLIIEEEVLEHMTPLAMGVNRRRNEDNVRAEEALGDALTDQRHLRVLISLPATQSLPRSFF